MSVSMAHEFVLFLNWSMNCERVRSHRRFWGFILLSCLFAAAAPNPSAASGAALAATPISPDPELENLLRGVENKYNRLKTLRLHFQQSYRQGQQILREEAGTLYLRKPAQMRWEYENPEPKLFLAEGKRLTLYLPEENRLTETEVANSDDLRSPLRFLLGGLRFQKEFQQIERAPDVPPIDSGDVVIKAVPKLMQNRLEWVELEITPQYQIRRMILKEPGGVQTEFQFKDEEADLRLAPELFHFQPPKGTQIIKSEGQ